jgi:hypothetical protein
MSKSTVLAHLHRTESTDDVLGLIKSLRLTSEDVEHRRIVRMPSRVDIPGDIWRRACASRSSRVFRRDRSHVVDDR